ncbi:hybrid sensor histidine kinase/response regulator [Wenyingzhuangia aestuarii]|uniref:hybrid sensor histidine kinase/response regulator n=1 Tax=Wenyingzhuangia aestuarii TaxID=1647582 RepID=UPI00143B1618|nr:hybrid sensor histidine kinase/response regulator [Wenyingzhuangia aestuarii]NJB82387.1 two-component system sensor histidine kinase/response regulator [Wenyingzhuangia aestuarii]
MFITKPPTPKILIVDDQQKNIQVLGSLLKNEDYIIGVAMNGQQAIDILKKTKDFDLILLDVNMPVMDGFEACKQIRKIEHLQKIPIIFLTAMIEEEQIVKGFEVGGHDYVTKPFNSKELLHRVHTHLELKQSRDKLQNINTWLEDEVEKRTLELKEANEKLKTVNKELETLDVAKNDFLSIISHEMNTPLNGIMGFINVLKDELKTSELIEFVNLLDISANRLLSFSKLSLRITELRTNTDTFKEENVSLNQVLGIIQIKTAKKLQAKAQTLSIKGDYKDTVVYGDPQLILYCLDNILDNAIQHSEEGGNITINIDNYENRIVCSIIDEGEGFSEYALTNLFKLFSSSKSHVDSNKGLGLALVKLIADAHNATIEVMNNPTKGATVKLTFPNN